MSSSARPDDRTIGAGTDWLAQVSVAARELAASHERLRSSTLPNESRLAGSSISLDPARDRFLHSEVASAPLSPLEIRSGFVLVGFTGFLLSVALTAVVVITQLGHPEKASQPALGRGIERGSWSGPLPLATLAMRDDLSSSPLNRSVFPRDGGGASTTRRSGRGACRGRGCDYQGFDVWDGIVNG